MRAIGTVIGATLLLCLSATTALAGGKPTIEFFQNPEQFEYAAGEACAFPVLVNTVIQKEYGITFVDAAGNPTRTLIHGRLVVRITNLNTGANVTLNESGPGIWIYNADGTISARLNGQSILIPPGVDFYEHSGPLDLLIGTDGVPALLDQLGTGSSPCELID
jgi:hypothetical protein